MAGVFDEHFNEFVDECQFGSVSGRSTTLALVKLAHVLYDASDDNCNIIRILFVDFSRAFDVIEHNVIADKLLSNNFPHRFSSWFLSFLNERSQFVKIGVNKSEIQYVSAGAPQGTRAGPNAFKLMINDLVFKIPFIKYVDDVTVAAVSHDPLDMQIHEAADHLEKWCRANGLKLNTNKTKEMILSFNKSNRREQCIPIVIGNNMIESVDKFKLLGVYFSSNLTWSSI